MFGSITIPYEAVMLYNVCKLKDELRFNPVSYKHFTNVQSELPKSDII